MKKVIKSRTLILKIEEEILLAIDDMAEQSNRNRSEIVRQIIRKSINGNSCFSITNCLIKGKGTNDPIKPNVDGGLDFNLDGYAIIPIEEYKELKAIAAQHALRYSGEVDMEGVETKSSHDGEYTLIEDVLAKDWNTTEEDEAWADL